MKTLLFLLRLLSGNWRWALAGLALAVMSMLANIALMAVSGSFLTGMAIAGAAGASFNYFVPAATIRALAILRSGSRYLERLATHEATFRLIGGLRARVFQASRASVLRKPGPVSNSISARQTAGWRR